jgi:cytoskeletal protein CcmA (bactofilin family)
VSEWQSPQDYPRRETDGVKRLVETVKVVAEQAREATSNLLRTAGLYLTNQGLRIASSLLVEGDLSSTGSADITGTTHIGGATDIDGTLNIGGATDIDGTLNVDAEMSVGGDATFSGAVHIEGTLSLPAGIIDNDALASPVTFLGDFIDNNSLTITTAETQQCIYSFVVPAGYSKALVVGYGSVGVVNPLGVSSSIGARIYIDRPIGGTVWGPQRFQQALAGSDAAAYPYKQTVISGLSGGETVTLRLVALNSGASNWGATPGGASLNVQAYFTRS